MIWLLLVVHAVVALGVAVGATRLGRDAFLVAAVAPLLAFVWLVARSGVALDGGITEQVSWVPSLGLTLDLRLDGMGLLMGLLVSGIGVVVLAYSRWYVGDAPGAGRMAGLLVAFAGAMLGLVVADNVFVLYGFWELTTVASFLLIGWEDQRAPARAAALQAFLVTGIGGLSLLAGLVLLGQAAGTWSLSGLLADPPTGGAVPAALVLVLVGAFTKSAQVPFHFWLPGAMAAPTPVSAYLHSATLVKAGVYLIALLAPAFAAGVGFWRPLVLGVGVATMVWGGWRALRQFDLKLLAAYGTVSQLGFLVVLFGAGVPALTFAGCAVLVAHALYKAALFLVVGVVDHQAHTRDLRRLDSLHRHLPVTFAVAAVSVASMVGIPLLFGFVAKEAAYQAIVDELGPARWNLLLVGVAAGSVLTVAYGARFLQGGFGRQPVAPGGHDLVPPPPRAPWTALLPPAVLAGCTVVLGLAPGLAAPLVDGAAEALLGGPAGAGGGGLALWHGANVALALSALTLVLGALVHLARQPIARFQAALPHGVSGAQAYQWCLRSVLRGADRLTGVVQHGSLPVYLAVTLVTAVALPIPALVAARGLDVSLTVAESPLQAVVVGIVVAAALAVAVARRRFTAVLLVGCVGYGVAVLFVIQGAPDLALTQLLVETLTLVAFVVVLRHLPDGFRPVRGRGSTLARVVVAGAVGTFVAAFAVVAASSRTVPPVSVEQVALAEPEGGGRNVVNVIVNDIRGLDTVGEVTVLVVAGLGVIALAAAVRPRRQAQEVTDGAP